jgi:hypothetical protein
MVCKRLLQEFLHHRFFLLSVEVAIDSIGTHSHWTGVHRAFLKTRSDFPVRKIAPTIRFTQPFPTLRGV